MKILVQNLGSTSFKCKLYQMDGQETLLATAGVENIGAAGSYAVCYGENKDRANCACATHADALTLCMEKLNALGLDIDLKTLDCIGYKAVHGGSISGSQVVDEALIAEMERMVSFAPAHNPIYLKMMKSVHSQHPQLLQIACFETAFHATIPQERYLYGIPYEWASEYGVRRYGFHGSSHSYIAAKMAEEAPHNKRIISAHLGGSSSLCAIADGRSIASSMGATPQSGVFHNNRVGDLDVFVLPLLCERLGGMDKVMKALSTQGGFLGLSGVSNDMRLIEEAAANGDGRAELALRAFADEVIGYIGMFTAYLGGLDALVFTGGIGLNAADFRRRVAERLGFIHAKIDPALNRRGYQGKISTQDSGAEIWVLETNEELMVARGCMKVLSAR